MAGPNRPNLFVQDLSSKLSFLVDSGAEVSLLPAQQADWATLSSGRPLVASQSIRSYRKKRVSLNFRKQRFSWSFIIADTPVVILSDFLLSHTLAVDPRRRCLFWWRESDWRANLAIIRGSVKSGTYPVRIYLVSECAYRNLLQG